MQKPATINGIKIETALNHYLKNAERCEQMQAFELAFDWFRGFATCAAKIAARVEGVR